MEPLPVEPLPVEPLPVGPRSLPLNRARPKWVEVRGQSIGVDTKEDLERVKKLL